MSADKPRRLGRGLEALLTREPAPQAAPAAHPEGGRRASSENDPQSHSAYRRLPISRIRANPYQPRREFKPDELSDLESSLRSSGLLQPISVRHAAPGASGQESWELIAGERRLRAATRLGWTEIPAIVHDIDDRTLLTLALVENLQRSDLNPIEEAEGFQRLIAEFELTQQQVADAVGKDRSTVANFLRLLNLPASVRRMVQEGQLTLGHARALLSLDGERQMVELAREAAAKGMSVRQVEAQVRESAPQRGRPRPASSPGTLPASSGGNAPTAETRRIAEELRRHLQTDVRLSLSAAERGTIEISFYSGEDLERLLDLMLGVARERL